MIYFVSCLSLVYGRYLVVSGFIFWVYWSHLPCKFPCLFHFVVFQYFSPWTLYAHSCVCNFIIFSDCVQQCVMTACVMTVWSTMCYHIQFDFLHLFSWIQVIGVRGYSHLRSPNRHPHTCGIGQDCHNQFCLSIYG